MGVTVTETTPPGGGGAGGPATIADGADVTQGAKADAAWDGVAAAPTEIAILKRLGASLPLTDAQFTAHLPLGTTNANIDVALSTRLKPADTLAGVTLVGTVSSITNVVHVDDNLGSLTVDAPVGTPVFARLSDGAAALIGQKLMTGSLPVAIASDQSNLPMNLTQVAGVATSLGQKVAASSLPVVLASDQSALPVNGDVDHDAINTLKNIQVAGHASPVDVPPTAVSATGDRVRAWLDRYGAQVVRRRKIRETYSIVFRLAETAARLDQTFTHTANANKQWATIHHLVGATKEVRLQLLIVWITSAITAAPLGIVELRSINTAPVTGNPAIVPTVRRFGGAAAEATALYLPTTAGTEVAVNSPLAHFSTDEAVSVATAAFQHPQGYGRGGLVLYDASQEDDEAMQPVLPVATLAGWALVTRMVNAVAMRLTALAVITEEVP